MSMVVAMPVNYVEPPRHEVLDGRIVSMSPRPAPDHSRISGNIYLIFRDYLQGRVCEAFWKVDVHLGRDIVIPDMAIVCDQNKIKDDGIHGAPDLIVEVLSPTTYRRDKGYKMKLYERSGVKEYWLVSTDSRSVEIYVLSENRYDLEATYNVVPDYLLDKLTDEQRAEVIYSFPSPTFPDMEISLADLFENIK